ncbi:MAG: response regulator [Candidatus Brennerbacteria bacterium]|nr:response regulator [Candidatus Brennerbacteria bacterium]
MQTQPLILLVDDDVQIQEIFSTRLKDAGFQVLQARNGEEGLKLAKQEKPDLILLDVMMPIMDGAKMLIEMKNDAEIKDIHVIFLTALDDRPESIKFAKESGAVDFVNKDIDFPVLLGKIKSILQI